MLDRGSKLLETENLTKRFGGLTAVDSLSISLEEGEIRGIIGPNGSGKTTLMNLISGIYKVTSGRIYLDGSRIDHLKPNVRTARGIIRTFQIPKVFRNMTVLENMLVPALSDSQGDRYKHHQEIVREAEELLKFVQLEHMKDQLAKTLSGGQNMLLQIAARALAQDARLYFMDEPFAGVDVATERAIIALLKELKAAGKTCVVVHHDLQTVPTYFDHVVLLNMRLVAAGPGSSRLI